MQKNLHNGRVTEGERKENGRAPRSRQVVPFEARQGLGNPRLGKACGKPSPRFPNWRHVRNGRKTEGERKETGSASLLLELGAVWADFEGSGGKSNAVPEHKFLHWTVNFCSGESNSGLEN